MDAIRNFKVKYPDMHEFIMFNLLSNVATITNFVVLAIGMSVLFKSFSSIQIVTNKTRGPMRALVKIRMAYEENGTTKRGIFL